MSSGPTVSVLVVTYNGRDHLARSLPALARQRGMTDDAYEVIIVDNAPMDDSVDDSASLAAACLPSAQIIPLPANHGFAGGMAAGLRHARGEWVAVLNDDATPEADWLQEMLHVVHVEDARETAAPLGMIAPAVLMAHNPARYESLGLAVTTAGMGSHAHAGALVRADDGSCEVLGPVGTGGLYRRAMLEQVGFFEEAFFLYYEDLDVALRARAHGWRCVTAPRARIHHLGTAMDDYTRAVNKIYYLHRNKLLVLARNWPMSLMLRYMPMIFVADVAALLRAIHRGQGRAALRARMDAAQSLLGLRAPAVHGRARTPYRDLSRWLIPVKAHLRERRSRSLRDTFGGNDA